MQPAAGQLLGLLPSNARRVMFVWWERLMKLARRQQQRDFLRWRGRVSPKMRGEADGSANYEVLVALTMWTRSVVE